MEAPHCMGPCIRVCALLVSSLYILLWDSEVHSVRKPLSSSSAVYMLNSEGTLMLPRISIQFVNLSSNGSLGGLFAACHHFIARYVRLLHTYLLHPSPANLVLGRLLD